MPFIVPPGGFSGFSQMTAASKRALSPAGATGARRGARKSGGKKRRKTSGKRRTSRKRGGGSSKRRSGARLPAFGSKAWRKKFKLDKKR